MPWPWLMATHCMDLATGTFHHWPVAGDWDANYVHLDCMAAVWRAWRHFSKPASQWDEHDVDYRAWLDEGREAEPKPKSDYEKWLEQKQAMSGEG